VEHEPGFPIKHAGDNESDIVQFARPDVFEQSLSDLDPEIPYKLLRIEFRRKADDVADLLAHRIGDHDECSRRPNIDGNGDSLLRIDIEKRWLPAANFLTSLCAFTDEAFL
jgi:hypothetical protein